MTNKEEGREMQQALVNILNSVPQLHERLTLQSVVDKDAFCRVLEHKLIPWFDRDYPLVVAITGGGSTGKSSLFNALIGGEESVVGSRAGISRRVLVAMHPEIATNEKFKYMLFKAFDGVPELLQDRQELTEPGTPKYIANEAVPKKLVLIDTPDFDTGDCEKFTNRDFAKPVLDASDVLLYIFTNSTYNNSGNTRFIRDTLNKIGQRESVLIYRCLSAYSNEEVQEHLDTVATHLYQDDKNRLVVGRYRVNEENDVARGERPMQLMPLNDGRSLNELLSSLDTAQVRRSQRKTAMLEVLQQAQATIESAEVARDELELYKMALREAAKQAMRDALNEFPVDEIQKHLSEAWQDTQPKVVKALNKVGKSVEKATVWVKEKLRKKGADDGQSDTTLKDYGEKFEVSLLSAINTLRSKLLNESITVEVGKKSCDIDATIETIKRVQKAYPNEPEMASKFESIHNDGYSLQIKRPFSLRNLEVLKRDELWKEIRTAILNECSKAGEISEHLKAELRKIVKKERSGMKKKDKFKEIFTTCSGPLITAVAITYVFATTGPVGLVFGLNDLAAVIALPAAAGLNKVDQKLLKSLIQPIFDAWFKEKHKIISTAIERHVTKKVQSEIENLLKVTEKPLGDLKLAVAAINKECEK